MKLNFPTHFRVEYPDENRKYYAASNKHVLANKLLFASQGFCMYCGKRINHDDNPIYNLEHSIEKTIDENEYYILRHCKFNISIACPTCNQKYKKRMNEIVDSEEVRKLLDVDEKECLQKHCKIPCQRYNKLKEEYLTRNHILLQPLGAEGCAIQYDMLKQVFRPNAKEKEKKSIIQEHINRFHLNSEMYSNTVLHICEFIVAIEDNAKSGLDCEGLFNILAVYRVENRIGLEFIDFLKEYFYDMEELLEFCEMLLILDFV